jgi:hypothetical protein
LSKAHQYGNGELQMGFLRKLLGQKPSRATNSFREIDIPISYRTCLKCNHRNLSTATECELCEARIEPPSKETVEKIQQELRTEKLIAILRAKDKTNRDDTVMALREIGSLAIQPLYTVLNHWDSYV